MARYIPKPDVDTEIYTNDDGSLTVGSGSGSYDILKPDVGQGIKGRGDAGQGESIGGNHLKYDAIKNIAGRGLNAEGDYDIGLIGQMTGVTQDDVQGHILNTEKKILEKKYGAKLGELGLADRGIQYGDTRETFERLLQTKNENKKIKASEKKRVAAEKSAAQRALELKQDRVDEINRIGTNQQNQMDYQMGRDKVVDQRYLDDRAEARAERVSARADKADDRAAELEMLQMKLASEDRRAEDRWAREDKLQRAQLISQLFSGLGQTAQFI